jgi:DNA-binding MarR family transcriptional regulator
MIEDKSVELLDKPFYQYLTSSTTVHNRLRQTLADGLSRHNIDLPTYDILASVYWNPGLTQSEMADKLFVGRSNLSMLMPELEENGLLRREASATDKRVRRLFLTPEGENKALIGMNLQLQLVKKATEIIGDAESEQIAASMANLSQYLDKNKFAL